MKRGIKNLMEMLLVAFYGFYIFSLVFTVITQPHKIRTFKVQENKGLSAEQKVPLRAQCSRVLNESSMAVSHALASCSNWLLITSAVSPFKHALRFYPGPCYKIKWLSGY